MAWSELVVKPINRSCCKTSVGPDAEHPWETELEYELQKATICSVSQAPDAAN